MIKSIIKVSAVSLGLVFLGGSAGVMAQEEIAAAPISSLKGTYELVRTRSCIDVPDVNFTTGNPSADNLPAGQTRNGADGGTRTDVLRATVTFDGKAVQADADEIAAGVEGLVGHGTQKHTQLTVRNDTTGFNDRAVRKSTAECAFTYQVFKDGSFIRKPQTCTVTAKLAGFGDNFTREITGVATAGQLAKGNQSFVLADVDTNIETLQNFGPDGLRDTPDDTKRYRICNRSGSGVKKSGGGDDD